MVIPHLGTSEICLLMSKRKRILGLRLSKNYLKQNFSKGLRPYLALIVVGMVISLRHMYEA
jgi:hypothetical protein